MSRKRVLVAGRSRYVGFPKISENQLEPAIMIVRRPKLANSQTVFGRSVMADDVQRHTPHQRQIGRRVILARAICILAELHIQHSVLTIRLASTRGAFAACALKR